MSFWHSGFGAVFIVCRRPNPVDRDPDISANWYHFAPAASKPCDGSPESICAIVAFAQQFGRGAETLEKTVLSRPRPSPAMHCVPYPPQFYGCSRIFGPWLSEGSAGDLLACGSRCRVADRVSVSSRRPSATHLRPRPVTHRKKTEATGRMRWLGRQDSNLRITGSKPVALPLGYAPNLYQSCAFCPCELCGAAPEVSTKPLLSAPVGQKMTSCVSRA